MANTAQTSPREFRDWSHAAVRLMQGVVYSDDGPVWDVLMRSRSSLESYFLRIGLQMVVDEPEGYAFLRQLDDEDLPEGYEGLPKLIRKVQLGYGPTVLAVLLRDELRKFEDEELHSERCVVDSSDLFGQWRLLLPAQHDEVRQAKDFQAALVRLQDLGFVRPFGDDARSWEIRRVLKARLAVSDLEKLKEQMVATLSERGRGSSHSGRPDE
jgi:hypothetical protein